MLYLSLLFLKHMDAQKENVIKGHVMKIFSSKKFSKQLNDNQGWLKRKCLIKLQMEWEKGTVKTAIENGR